jgi:hypothetical protein
MASTCAWIVDTQLEHNETNSVVCSLPPIDMTSLSFEAGVGL